MSKQLPVHIRFAISKDMPQILEIERMAFGSSWTVEDFKVCLSNKNNIGMVAECRHGVVGFMIYDVQCKSIVRVHNFAVDPEFHRCGVGSQMVQHLIDRLSRCRRKEIILAIRETNLLAQLFLKSHGFQCVHVARRYYDDTGEDAYAMRYSLEEEFSWHAIANGEATLAELENGVVLEIETP